MRGILIVLLAAATTACAARGGVPRPFPGAALPPGAGAEPAERAGTPSDQAPEAPSAAVPVPPSELPSEPGVLTTVVNTALAFLGVPYRSGGSDPSGFDCSGFVQYVFAQHGTPLPREVRHQYVVGREIDLKDIKAGDLLFFETVTRGASHVGMALDDGRFIHAPSSRGVVRVEPYTASYWIRRFVGARRVTGPSDESVRARPLFPGWIRSSR